MQGLEVVVALKALGTRADPTPVPIFLVPPLVVLSLCFLHRVFPKMKSKLEKATLLRDISGWFAVTTGSTPDVRDEKHNMDSFDNGSEIRAG